MSNEAAPAQLTDLRDRLDTVAKLLKLLGHPQRLHIACLLHEGDYAVSEIEARLGIHQPTLSQQLSALREAGVVKARRSAKAVIYQLDDEPMRQLLTALHRTFCPEGASAAAAPLLRAPENSLDGAASFARVSIVQAVR